MNTSFRLRVADESALSKILPLFRAYQAHYSALTDANESQTREFIRSLLVGPERGFFIVAESENAVVGFASGYVTVSGVMAEKMIHLGDLFVAPEHRHHGIGTALIERVTAEAKLRGIKWVRWLSLASNTNLNAWYQSLGAKPGDFKLFLKPTGL
ncbi:MAG: GNAT family N-acetyltransferase [Nibricoccus sp.]